MVSNKNRNMLMLIVIFLVYLLQFNILECRCFMSFVSCNLFCIAYKNIIWKKKLFISSTKKDVLIRINESWGGTEGEKYTFLGTVRIVPSKYFGNIYSRVTNQSFSTYSFINKHHKSHKKTPVSGFLFS